MMNDKMCREFDSGDFLHGDPPGDILGTAGGISGLVKGRRIGIAL